MSIRIWKIHCTGVLPNGQKHEINNYIIVEDNFHARQNNDYIGIASEPLYREDVEQLIAGEVELTDFELTQENADYYSEDSWEHAQKLVEEDWQSILQDQDLD
ncbi:hypothetical protein COO91_03413 [Nostoc flagelliforme CCNUN1]|uniref:Uncharacterized protein n=1 Tax=Nostoc flagelliforme CCNUN1 TaxID=2038116 RepID=A0A2K8SPY1_9NOSO|nr:hypothetical protein [Nostoc flagelliforme]AUB37468.1 hypothetical protein COO91_03413 [Nostoc flagelliforme CCNUN1]